MDGTILTNQKTRQLWVGALSAIERKEVLLASKICGVRKSEFYRIAILEKTQSVLSSIDNQAQPKASPEQKPEDASFLSEEKIGREWK